MDRATHMDGEDPRLTGEHVREVSEALTLVGVVHDHPSSMHRVRQVVDAADPDVLALELPPLAVPLFEEYARTEGAPPAFGGEMSAAIQAARTDVTAGIDRPDVGFGRRLVETLVRERPSRSTVRRVLGNVVSATKHAVVCRVAAAVAARTGVRLEVDRPETHAVDRSATPAAQARDERTQVQQARAFMDAFRGTATSQASRMEDRVREEHMADRIATLQNEGSVVAVVGIDHLDPLARSLDGEDAGRP